MTEMGLKKFVKIIAICFSLPICKNSCNAKNLVEDRKHDNKKKYQSILRILKLHIIAPHYYTWL